MSGSAELPRILSGSPAEVAPRLLNSVLAHDSPEGRVAVRITEVEAYGGADDPGSHAYRGRTARNDSMFGRPGHLYVYFTYGMHCCANIVTGDEGAAGAVLLRAGEIIEGLDLARSRRGRGSDRDLARGPARLCEALGLSLSDDGADLFTGSLMLQPAPGPPPVIMTGPRVGLRGAAERPWRFWIDGDPTVSSYRPATPRRR